MHKTMFIFHGLVYPDTDPFYQTTNGFPNPARTWRLLSSTTCAASEDQALPADASIRI